MERTDVLVIGGGQAGIAAGWHLRERRIPHLILERGRVAERWRSERWDSLVANGPAWHDRFPVRTFNSDQDGFPTAAEVADYFERLATDMPVRTGVEVTRLRRDSKFRAETSHGPIEADAVIVATGPFQRPVMPDHDIDGVRQLHSSSYKSPDQLPDGAVLVVGSGSSGAQIADELLRSGRRTFLSVGPHNRPPRRYRGIDYCWWLGVLGKWDATEHEPGREHVTIAVSGARGGATVDFREMAQRGMTLLGRAEGHAEGAMRFAPDLAENIARGDADLMSVLDEADAYADRMGLELPVDLDARMVLRDPACLTDPITELDLRAEGIAAIVWAIGYRPNYDWMEVGEIDGRGHPVHQRGASPEPDLYYLGLPWQSRRGSSFIWGVWHDAAYVTEQIAIRRAYAEHLGDKVHA